MFPEVDATELENGVKTTKCGTWNGMESCTSYPKRTLEYCCRKYATTNLDKSGCGSDTEEGDRFYESRRCERAFSDKCGEGWWYDCCAPDQGNSVLEIGSVGIVNAESIGDEILEFLGRFLSFCRGRGELFMY